MTEIRIHDTAIVEPGSQIGDGTAVWHHSHVRAGAVIGRDCVLGKNVYIDPGAVLGDGVKVQNNVSVWRGVELADDVFVATAVVFTNDQHPRSRWPEFVLARTFVGRGASIGAGAVVLGGHTIGEYALVGAGSVVTRDVPAHGLVVGNPARQIGWVCECGQVSSREPVRPSDVRCDECREAAE